MSLMDTLLHIDVVAAREFLGETKGRTISAVVGDGLDHTLGLRRGVGKDLFHGALFVGGVVGLQAAAARYSGTR
ncbi:MAG: hypothetical protein KC621_31985 [Myxococcales bacterium]|nr:hypothetical protein [Myxococcales bacterium]